MAVFVWQCHNNDKFTVALLRKFEYNECSRCSRLLSLNKEIHLGQ